MREGEREEESERVPLYFLLLIVIRKLRPALVNSVFKYLGTGRGTSVKIFIMHRVMDEAATRFTSSIEIICPPHRMDPEMITAMSGSSILEEMPLL